MRRFLTTFTILTVWLSLSRPVGGRAGWWPEREAFRSTGGAYTEKPNPSGAYIYDAESALVLEQDIRLASEAPILKDDGLVFAPAPFARAGMPRAGAPGGMLYWTLDDIAPGRYWLGLVVYTGHPEGDVVHGAARPYVERAEDPRAYFVRVNGRLVEFSTLNPPVAVSADACAAEMQSAAPVDLQPGDRISVNQFVMTRDAFIGRLTLYPGEPVRGPILRAPQYAPEHLTQGEVERWHTTLRIALAHPEGPARASYTIQNRANGPQRLTVALEAVDYYGITVGAATFTHDLADGGRAEQAFDFPVGAAPRYRVRMRVNAADGQAETAHAFLLSEVREGNRPHLSLSGEWEKVLVPGAIEIGAPPVPEAEWQRYRVPGRIRMGVRLLGDDHPHRHTHVAWARRRFTVPDWARGERYVLRFQLLAQEATIFVNGQKVGFHFGVGHPCEVDVTEALRPDGENEVLVGLRDWIARVDPDVLRANGPIWDLSPRGSLIAPGMSGLLDFQPHVGLLDHVSLLARPAVAVTDVYAEPSVRTESLRIEVDLVNASDAARTVTIEPVIRDNGRDVQRLPFRTVTLTPGAAGAVELRGPFQNARLWWPLRSGKQPRHLGFPDSGGPGPHLYELAVRVRDAESGETLDEHRSRFGFREIYIEDGLYKINGVVWKTSARRFHLQVPPKHQIDEMDERGELAKLDEIGGIYLPTEFVIYNDRYWENAEAFARASMRAFRNHPAVAVWAPSNEFLCFTRAMPPGPDGRSAVQWSADRLAGLGRAMREMDPLRPVEFDAEGDLVGQWNTISLHYAIDHRPFDRYGNHYLPDAYLFRPMDQPLRTGDPYTLWSNGLNIPARYREKPVSAGEIGQFSIAVAHHLSVIGGDEPYRNMAAGIHIWEPRLDRYILDGCRDIEMSFYTPWCHVPGAHDQVLMPPRYAVALDYMGHWRAGERVRFQVNIHHDVLAPEPVTVRWRLVGPEGRVLRDGTLVDRMFAPGELARKDLVFDAPRLAAETRGRFHLEVLSGGETQFAREAPFVVHPAAVAPVRLARRWGRYDPEGGAVPALEVLGLEMAAVDARDADALANLDALLIGPDAVTEARAARLRPVLEAFVVRGGRVVALEQRRPGNWLPYPVTADPGQTSSFAFPAAPDHPALAGLTREDLRLWRDNRAISTSDYLKPSAGRFRSLVDTGGWRGLEWSALLEVYAGRGSYLLSQFLLAEKAGVDPCAARLLANLLRYADTVEPEPAQVVGVVTDPDSPLARTFGRIRARVPILSVAAPEIDAADALVVDADAVERPEDVRRLVSAADRGARVVVRGLTAGTAPLWAEALDCRIELRPIFPYYRGRLIRTHWDDLLSGLTMHDFHWHSPGFGDQDSCQVRFRLEELAATEIVTDAPGARSAAYPAVFVRIPRGAGSLVLDQTRWDAAGEAVGPRARRIASTLLTRLGAEFEAVPGARTLEGPLAYLPLDLSGFVNRPLADETPDDGLGGWTDQGPRNDGRDFPLGRVTLRSVPFVIGADGAADPHQNAVIVLTRERKRFRDPFPEVRGIPVNRRIETLNVLHTGGWMARSLHYFDYIVRYADGTFEEIPVIGGINIMDWWLDHMIRRGWTEFSREIPGLSAWLGLIGETPTFEAVGVYQMEWINPHPEREVAALDIVQRSWSVAIVMAVTIGIDPADLRAEDRAVPAGDAEAAARLTAQAEARIAARDREGALDALRAAVAADPDHARAHLLVGRLHRDAGHWDEAVPALRRAGRLLSDNPDVRNELAEVLERRGKTAQAIAVYRQSLEIEWNQPPVIEAIGRLLEQ